MRVLGSFFVLGLVAASCDSDAKKQAPPANYSAAGEGDDTGEAGAGTAGAAGKAPGMGGDSGAPGEAGAPADNGGAMPGGGTGGSTPNGGSGGAVSTAMTDGYLSGTRLRAVLEVAGTAQRFSGWHDSLLNIDCGFQVDSAGVQRCAPQYSQGAASFSDTACKVPVVNYGAGIPAAKYVEDPGYAFTCGSGPHFLPVGAVVNVTQFHRKDDTGTCVDDGTISAGQTVYALGAAVPVATFVSATKSETEARDARLTATIRVASDGSRELASFYDSSRKTECNPLEVSAGGWACVPDAKAYIEYFFTDAGCMTPAAFHPGYAQQTCGFTPDIVQNTSPNFMSSYYEVGPKIETAVHNSNGATCPVYAAPGSSGATFYSVGKPLPISVFPSFTLTTEGAGRIQIQTLRNSLGGLIGRLGFYDSTLNTPCSAGQAADLLQRCLPATSYGLNLFSDDQCKQLMFETTAGSALPSDLVYLGGLQTNGGQAVSKIGTKVATPAHTYQLTGLTCEERSVTPGEDYYASTLIAPSDLVLVTTKVE